MRVADEDVSMAGDEGDASPEGGRSATIGEEEADEVPAGSSSNNITCAGLLSPRGYNGRCSGGEGVHGVMETLHLDQVALLEQGGRRGRGRGVRAKFPLDRELRSVSNKTLTSFQILLHD